MSLAAECHQVQKQAEHAPGGRQRREQRRHEEREHDELIHARMYRPMDEKSTNCRIYEFTDCSSTD